MRTLRLLPALLALALLRATPAHACSAPPTCPVRAVVIPWDGTLDVPTNTELQITYELGCYGVHCESRGEAVRLRAVGGEEIPLVSSAWSSARVRPAIELAPRTTYEILDLAWDTGGVCEPDQTFPLVVIATFTTGDGPDLVAPSAPTTLRSGACLVDVCTDSACCGPYDAATNRLDWDESTDDRDHPLAYALGGSLVAPGVTLYTFTSAWPGAHFPCEGSCVQAFGSGAYSVVAVDLAGNVSAPSEAVTVDLSCAAPRDAGVPAIDASAPPPDAGTDSGSRDGGVDAGSIAPTPGSGCSVGRGPRSSGSAAIAVVLLALVLRGRASRRRAA